MNNTVYSAFWKILPTALIIAELKHDFPERAADVIAAVLKVEMGPDGSGGQTGYLGNEDNGVAGADLAALRVKQLIAAKYDGAEPPTWMANAGI